MNFSKQSTIFVGILLLLIGIELRAVETIVLRPEATSFLASITGPGTDTPHGAVRQYVVESSSMRKAISPPNWLGWAFLSSGAVVVVFALRKL